VGKKSIQIRKHIEDERLRLDRNLLELERQFATTKSTLLAWWHNPPALFSLTAFAAGFLLAKISGDRTGAGNATNASSGSASMERAL
jgi:hypothetical protein